MKQPKRTQLALLALAGGIWFHGSLLAQEPTSGASPGTRASWPKPPTRARTRCGRCRRRQFGTSQGRGSGSWAAGVHRHDVELKEGESAECVVAIFGSAKVRGKVRAAAVAVFGDLDIAGEVGDAAVWLWAIFGYCRRQGPREAVAVGGKVDAASTASIRGQPVTVDFPTG